MGRTINIKLENFTLQNYVHFSLLAASLLLTPIALSELTAQHCDCVAVLGVWTHEILIIFCIKKVECNCWNFAPQKIVYIVSNNQEALLLTFFCICQIASFYWYFKVIRCLNIWPSVPYLFSWLDIWTDCSFFWKQNNNFCQGVLWNHQWVFFNNGPFCHGAFSGRVDRGVCNA